MPEDAMIEIRAPEGCRHEKHEHLVEAAKLGLIAPILVGPAARIRDVAARANLDIGGMPIVDAAHS